MNEKIIRNIPIVPLRGIVIFPGMTLHFDVGRKYSLAAIKSAAASNKEVFFVAQKDISCENPEENDLYTIGVTGKIRQIIRTPEKGAPTRVVVEGISRAGLLSLETKTPFYRGDIELLETDCTLPRDSVSDKKVLDDAVLFSIRQFFDMYCEHASQIAPDIVDEIYGSKENLSDVADFIAGNIMLSLEDRQTILSTLNVYARCEKLCLMLANETQVLILDEELQDKVQRQMDDNQREYFLREEMKIISDELTELCGDDDTGLHAKIEASLMPEDNKIKLFGELDRMRKFTSSSPDYNVLRTYIEKCLDIPWGVYTKENTDIKKAKRILEKDHYGLCEVKERITELLAAIIISPDIKGQIICLAGPPGVGKTSVAKSIARATGRKYARVSLGGVKDEAEIRGHRRTYIGAMPGRIINALIEAKSANPLILLDEVDKLGGDYKGDPASALLEALDGEQNSTFSDHYVDMPVDLSKVLFITTANDKSAIPDALRDRMEIIDIPGYTYEEKFNIAKKHLVKKQMSEHSLTKENLRFTDSAIREIIDCYTREAGVRILERHIAKICRKEALRLVDGNTETLVVSEKNTEELLGVKKYRPEEKKHTPRVGVVNGLAWTAAGGEMLEAEAVVLEGKGVLDYTGSLGDVMKESVKTAVSFIRSRADVLGIDSGFYKDKDIHVHFPEGAVPKDGPSAGVTITTAVVSALTGREVRGDVAMTGEITLTGRVLQIGGLREKSMAAYTNGIKYVLIPEGNVPDLAEVDPAVKAKVEFIPVSTADEVLSFVLLPAKTDSQAKSSRSVHEIKIPPFAKNERGGAGNELQ